MKLYATVTSERASKGQGGESLNIKITGESRELLYNIYVFMQGNICILNGHEWHYIEPDNKFRKDFKRAVSTKGERQKGECVYHGVVNCSRCDDFKR